MSQIQSEEKQKEVPGPLVWYLICKEHVWHSLIPKAHCPECSQRSRAQSYAEQKAGTYQLRTNTSDAGTEPA